MNPLDLASYPLNITTAVLKKVALALNNQQSMPLYLLFSFYFLILFFYSCEIATMQTAFAHISTLAFISG